MPKLVVPGGSGFLGRIAAQWFDRLGWEVVVLSRAGGRLHSPGRIVAWDGQTLGPWRHELDGADAVLNLAGRSVDCRYTPRNRQAILSSRIDSTRVIGQASHEAAAPPPVWLNASTATIYKHSFDRAMDETTGTIAGTPEVHDAFSVAVAQAWEQTLAEADTPATRKVALRAAMVMGPAPGTVYRVLRRLVRLRLGGPMAGGCQYVSWLHETDFCRALGWLIDRHDICGPVNLAAPEPLTNRDLMRSMREACGVRLGLPATRWMLEFGAALLRTETELILKSRRVIPARLLAAGFKFTHPDFASALNDLEGRLAKP